MSSCYPGEQILPSPSKAVLQEARTEDRTIRVVRIDELVGIDRLEVWSRTSTSEREQLLYAFSGERYSFGDDAADGNTPVNVDINADPFTEVVVREWTGGAHCCFTDHIISLGPDVRIIESIPLGHAGNARWEIDESGRWIMRTHDTTFAYWRTAFAFSPMPTLMLADLGGRFGASELHMVKEPLMRSVVESEAQRIRPMLEIERSGWDIHLASIMLDWIYSGRREGAWRLLDLVLPSGHAERFSFEQEFRSELESSPWWEDIRMFEDPGIQ